MENKEYVDNFEQRRINFLDEEWFINIIKNNLIIIKQEIKNEIENINNFQDLKKYLYDLDEKKIYEIDIELNNTKKSLTNLKYELRESVNQNIIDRNPILGPIFLYIVNELEKTKIDINQEKNPFVRFYLYIKNKFLEFGYNFLSNFISKDRKENIIKDKVYNLNSDIISETNVNKNEILEKQIKDIIPVVEKYFINDKTKIKLINEYGSIEKGLFQIIIKHKNEINKILNEETKYYTDDVLKTFKIVIKILLILKEDIGISNYDIGKGSFLFWFKEIRYRPIFYTEDYIDLIYGLIYGNFDSDFLKGILENEGSKDFLIAVYIRFFKNTIELINNTIYGSTNFLISSFLDKNFIFSNYFNDINTKINYLNKISNLFDTNKNIFERYNIPFIQTGQSISVDIIKNLMNEYLILKSLGYLYIQQGRLPLDKEEIYRLYTNKFGIIDKNFFNEVLGKLKFDNEKLFKESLLLNLEGISANFDNIIKKIDNFVNNIKGLVIGRYSFGYQVNNFNKTIKRDIDITKTLLDNPSTFRKIYDNLRLILNNYGLKKEGDFLYLHLDKKNIDSFITDINRAGIINLTENIKSSLPKLPLIFVWNDILNVDDEKKLMKLFAELSPIIGPFMLFRQSTEKGNVNVLGMFIGGSLFIIDVYKGSKYIVNKEFFKLVNYSFWRVKDTIEIGKISYNITRSGYTFVRTLGGFRYINILRTGYLGLILLPIIYFNLNKSLDKKIETSKLPEDLKRELKYIINNVNIENQIQTLISKWWLKLSYSERKNFLEIIYGFVDNDFATFKVFYNGELKTKIYVRKKEDEIIKAMLNYDLMIKESIYYIEKNNK